MAKQPKIDMPNYTKVGYQSARPMIKNQDDNKIKAMPGGEQHYYAPGQQYKADSVQENKQPPRDNKLRGMPPHQYVNFGVPVSVKVDMNEPGDKIKGKAFGKKMGSA